MERFDVDDDQSVSSDSQLCEPIKSKKATRGKRRAANDDRNMNSSKRAKNDIGVTAALPSHGYPLEHPFNKDGYIYHLAEPDPHADRRTFDQDSWAGKPVPGEIYRVALQPGVFMSLNDRAPQLKLSDDRLSVTGEKGYSIVRANYAVSRGNWYFEIDIVDMPEGTAARLGWCQVHGNLQAPLGYDKFSYSWRSRKGTTFHQSRGKHYSEEYKCGDTLGFLIELPNKIPGYALPKTFKNMALIKFKNHLHYEEKDVGEQLEKSLKKNIGSKITFFKNGVSQGLAFSDIHHGSYFPAASVYKGATVRFNFGPNLKYPPVTDLKYRTMHEKVEEMAVEQSLADLIFLTVFNEVNSKKSVTKTK